MTDAEYQPMLRELGVHVLAIPTPFAIGKVNAFLFEGSPLTLVDCGPNSATSLAALEDIVAGTGHRIEEIERLVITHQHMDHLGLAALVARRSGAEVAALRAVIPYLERWEEWAGRDDDYAVEVMVRHGLEPHISDTLRSVSALMRGWGAPTNVDLALDDGRSVRLGDRDYTIGLRPGHSPSDTVFFDDTSGLLVAGDHLLRNVSSNAVIAHPLSEGPWTGLRPRSLIIYRESLAATRAMEPRLVVGGHGGPISDTSALIDERIAAQDDRAARLLELLRSSGPRSAHELAVGLWERVAITQAFLTLSEVLGHLDLLVAQGVVVERETENPVLFEAV
jgi:glyoxylase-like metal-dependent hydrolase (beta-lactamase superfamily II)